MAIDNAGRAYLAGDTTSINLPTKNADQAASGGGDDAFVAAFDTTQAGAASLVYATYLGGSGNDVATDIAVDGAGAAYVTGNTNSSNFPTTAGAYQPAYGGACGATACDDAFVVKLAPGGRALSYATYVGWNGEDTGAHIALDPTGGAWVTGATTATNWITTTNALQPSYGGQRDVTLFHLNAAGAALLYSTYLGGNDYDTAGGLALTGAGTVYVVGTTYSGNFPVQGASQARRNGVDDAFVSAVGGDGRLAWSTYLGAVGPMGPMRSPWTGRATSWSREGRSRPTSRRRRGPTSRRTPASRATTIYSWRGCAARASPPARSPGIRTAWGAAWAVLATGSTSRSTWPTGTPTWA